MTTQELVMVRVNGHEYPTIWINGVQRFKPSALLVHLIASGVIDLNALQVAYCAQAFPKQEYIEFLAKTGYSVVALIDAFPGIEVENPLWEERR